MKGMANYNQNPTEERSTATLRKGSNLGCDDGYAPPMSSNESKTRARCSPKARLIEGPEVYVLRVEFTVSPSKMISRLRKMETFDDEPNRHKV